MGNKHTPLKKWRSWDIWKHLGDGVVILFAEGKTEGTSVRCEAARAWGRGMVPSGPPFCSEEVVMMVMADDDGDILVDDLFQFSLWSCGTIITLFVYSWGNWGMGKLPKDWLMARDWQT